VADKQTYRIQSVEIVEKGWRMVLRPVGENRWGEDWTEVVIVVSDKVGKEVMVGGEVTLTVEAAATPPKNWPIGWLTEE
jgi:hypothetical protein